MLKICGHRVLVKQDALEDTDDFYKSAKKAGFTLPDHRDIQLARKSVDVGTVIQVGENAFKAYDDGHAWCQVGDRVCWVRHGGYLVVDPEDKQEYVCLNDEDILVVIGN